MTQASILEKCLQLERMAVAFYRKLADAAFSPTGLVRFWKDMAEQEAQHVLFWERLLELQKGGGLPRLFDRPETIVHELERLSDRADGIIHGDVPKDLIGAFLSAYRMELLLLHPALPAFFLILGKRTGDLSPGRTYREPLGGLIREARHAGLADSSLDLLADLMERHWLVQQDLAERMAEIQDLRALVPICSYCKNVRNDKGYWEKVEAYVERHYPAEFSHGICPDCIRKHFPEYFEDEKKK